MKFCSHLEGGELEVSSVAEQPPSMVGDHISSPGLVAQPSQHTEGFRLLSQRPQHTDLYGHL